MEIRGRLSRRLAVLVFGGSLLTGLIAGVWISLSAERDATAKLQASLERTADRYESRMELELGQRTRVGVAIAALFQQALVDPDAPRHAMDLAKGPDGALRAIVGDYGAHLAKRSELTPRIRRDIEAMFHIGPKLGKLAALTFHNFYFEAADGDLLFETPSDWPRQVQPDEDYKPYFALVSPEQDPGREPAWKPVYYDGIQKLWMTSLRVPLYDGDRFLGAVGYDYALDTILEDVRRMDRVEGWCRAFVITATGDLVVHPDYMESIQTGSVTGAELSTAKVANEGVQAFVGSILSQASPRLDGQEFVDGGERTYASVRTIQPLGWRLILYAPRSAVTEPLRGAQVEVLVTSTVLAVVLGLLLHVVFRRVVLDPLAALATSARQLGGGQWDAPLPPVRDDEIGSLTLTFNDMAGKLQELVTMLEERVERRTAELASAKEAAEATSEQLAQVNKDLRAFSSSVSHDLRGPLRSIEGWSQALEEDCGAQLDSVGREHLGRVRSAARRMGQLIDDLLRLSRVTQAEVIRNTVNVSGLAEGIAAGLRDANPERKVECVIQPGLVVEGDLGLLRAALDNLLGNAWKFTGKHPTARIELGRMEKDGAAVYYVRDDGAGFDMTYAARLFEPFQRMHKHSDFPGTGIGMATVKSIISRHGGRVWVESAVEQGTTVFFTIPPVKNAST